MGAQPEGHGTPTGDRPPITTNALPTANAPFVKSSVQQPLPGLTVALAHGLDRQVTRSYCPSGFPWQCFHFTGYPLSFLAPQGHGSDRRGGAR
jgi:hypothetical protein